MSEPIEFGEPVACAFFRSLKVDGEPVRMRSTAPEAKAASRPGKLIAGLATAYYEFHDAITGQAEIFAPGCFDATLKGAHKVALLCNHKPDLKIADTDDRLELHSDADGLWFRFWPTEAKHQMIVDAVADGTLSQMSIGYVVLRESWFKVAGIERRMIHEAALGEISLLAGGTAAVKSTAAVLADVSEIKTELRDDVADIAGVIGRLRLRIKRCC